MKVEVLSLSSVRSRETYISVSELRHMAVRGNNHVPKLQGIDRVVGTRRDRSRSDKKREQ